MIYNQHVKKPRPYSDAQLKRAYDEGATITELALRYNIGRKVIQTDVERIVSKRRSPIPRNQKRESNGNWRGGLFRHKRSGYVWVRMPDHPNAGDNGYVAQHTIVACQKYELNQIPKGQEVHHIDLEKTNNDPSNLFLVDKRNHNELHWQLQSCAVELMKRGLIEFNEKQGYIICG